MVNNVHTFEFRQQPVWQLQTIYIETKPSVNQMMWCVCVSMAQLEGTRWSAHLHHTTLLLAIIRCANLNPNMPKFYPILWLIRIYSPNFMNTPPVTFWFILFTNRQITGKQYLPPPMQQSLTKQLLLVHSNGMFVDDVQVTPVMM